MDIPNLASSKFSATAVRDIAQNIISFLNNNCAKEGHTYWLFKPHGDEIVKLYDLTSICETAASDSKSESESNESGDMQNPFAIPVAFLLYRVAKNLVAKFSEDSQRLEVFQFFMIVSRELVHIYIVIFWIMSMKNEISV